MHDLIHECIKHFNGGALRSQEIQQRFWTFFEKEWIAASYHFQRALQMHGARLRAEIGEWPEPSLKAYLSLLIESPPVQRNLIEHLAAEELRDHVDDRAACLAIIEAIEQRDRYTPSPEKEAPLHDAIANIDRALDFAPPDVKLDLLHHRGKFHLWTKQKDAARADFERVLEIDPRAYHAHLQLARIKTEASDATTIEHLAIIIRAFNEDRGSVAITVVLAAFAQLGRSNARRPRLKLLRRHVELLREAIELGIAEGFSQPYRTLGRVARYFYYEYPHFLVSLSTIVVFPPTNTPTPRDAFDIAECLKTIGKAHAELAYAAELVRRWYEQALPYYQLTEKPNDFETTMIAECLILLQNYEPAIKLLDAYAGELNSPHWWHRRAQALRGRGDLSAIQNALKMNRDADYAAVFLQVRAQIEADSRDPQCIATLREALGAAQGKFRDKLQSELSELQARLG